MKRALVALALVVQACSAKPEDDPDLRAQLSGKLKDPSSAQFQMTTKNDHAICGEYNSKNSFGAYAGFTAFVYDRDSQELHIEPSDQSESTPQEADTFDKAMKKCANYMDLFLRSEDRFNASMSARIK